MKVHTSISAARVAELYEASQVSLESPGICVKCGGEQYGVEPDARRYVCEHCGEHGVYGIEELALELGL